MFTEAIMWMLISQFDCVCQKNYIVYGKENMIPFTTVKQRGFTEKPSVSWVLILLMTSGIWNASFQAVGQNQTSIFSSICTGPPETIPQRSQKNI